MAVRPRPYKLDSDQGVSMLTKYSHINMKNDVGTFQILTTHRHLLFHRSGAFDSVEKISRG